MGSFEIVAPELEMRLPGIRPKGIFGSKGWATGNSVFAFVHDDEELVVKSEKYASAVPLPKDLSYFQPGDHPVKTWICIPIADDLKALRKYWHLIEESYHHAVVRDQLKKKKGK